MQTKSDLALEYECKLQFWSFFPGFLISKAADFNLMGMQDHPFYLHFEIWLRSKLLQWEACGMKLTSQAITLLY